jgi:hypothetical protein
MGYGYDRAVCRSEGEGNGMAVVGQGITSRRGTVAMSSTFERPR